MCKNCKSDLVKTTAHVDHLGNSELVPLFTSLSNVLAKYYDIRLQEALLQIENVVTLEKTIDVDIEDEIIADVTGILQKIYLVGQTFTLGQVLAEMSELAIELQTTLSIKDEVASERASKRAGELIKNIDQSSQEVVGSIVKKALDEWRSKKKLAETIHSKFSEYNLVRSKLIAQQEVAIAYETSKYEQFTDLAGKLGQEGRKRNIDQGDAKVRPEHKAATAAGWILVSIPFPWTNTAYAPHDYNCRCVTDYRVFHPENSIKGLELYPTIQVPLF